LYLLWNDSLTIYVPLLPVGLDNLANKV